jgi:hypothetical protein
MSDIQTDEQSRDLFEDAGVFQFAAVDGTNPGDFAGEGACELTGASVIAAHDDVAVNCFVAIEKFRGQIVECGSHAHSLRNEFSGLLGGRALPDAKRA